MTIARPLYAIVTDQLVLIEELLEAGGVITPDWQARFDAVVENRDERITACAYAIRNLEAEEVKWDTQTKRTGKLAAAYARSVASLKAYTTYQMQAAGLTELEGVAAIVRNGGVPSVKYDGKPEDLPEPYRTVTVAYGLDREAVLAAHALKQPLPEGVSVERGTHLKIKV